MSCNQTGGSGRSLGAEGKEGGLGPTHLPLAGENHMHLRPGLPSPDDGSHENTASSPGQGLHGPPSIPYSLLWLQPLLSSQVLIPGLLWHHTLFGQTKGGSLCPLRALPHPPAKCTLLLALTRLSVSEVGPLVVRKGHWCRGPL